MPHLEGLGRLVAAAADSIAGIVIPDTALVREITAFIREAEDDLLVDHSRRVFLFGAVHGRRCGLQPDLELLYAGVMFHDIGLTEPYRTSMPRFEVDGANAARGFLLERRAKHVEGQGTSPCE
jgi:HD superfamily phosphodiesterase